MKQVIISWGIFLALGGLMGALRYTNILPSEYLKMMKDYGPYVMAGIYLILILDAFKTGAFTGILALLIPFYPFYYLFMVSDNFYLRAVIAGICVGIGEDSLYFYQAHFSAIFDDIQRWLNSGGGDLEFD